MFCNRWWRVSSRGVRAILPLRRSRGSIAWPLVVLIALVFGICGRKWRKTDVPFLCSSPPDAIERSRPILWDRRFSNPMRIGEARGDWRINSPFSVGDGYLEIYRYGTVLVRRDEFVFEVPLLLTNDQTPAKRDWERRRIDQIHPDSQRAIPWLLHTSPISQIDPLIELSLRQSDLLLQDAGLFFKGLPLLSRNSHQGEGERGDYNSGESRKCIAVTVDEVTRTSRASDDERDTETGFVFFGLCGAYFLMMLLDAVVEAWDEYVLAHKKESQKDRKE